MYVFSLDLKSKTLFASLIERSGGKCSATSRLLINLWNKVCILWSKWGDVRSEEVCQVRRCKSMKSFVSNKQQFVVWLHEIRSQWSEDRSGVLDSNDLVLIILAAVFFWTSYFSGIAISFREIIYLL